MPTRKDPNYLKYYEGPDEGWLFESKRLPDYSKYLLDASTGLPLVHENFRWKIEEDWLFGYLSVQVRLQRKVGKWLTWWSTEASSGLIRAKHNANLNDIRWIAASLLHDYREKTGYNEFFSSIIGTYPPNKL